MLLLLGNYGNGAELMIFFLFFCFLCNRWSWEMGIKWFLYLHFVFVSTTHVGSMLNCILKYVLCVKTKNFIATRKMCMNQEWKITSILIYPLKCMHYLCLGFIYKFQLWVWLISMFLFLVYVIAFGKFQMRMWSTNMVRLLFLFLCYV